MMMMMRGFSKSDDDDDVDGTATVTAPTKAAHNPTKTAIAAANPVALALNSWQKKGNQIPTTKN